MNEKIEELIVKSDLDEIIDDAYKERSDWQPFVERFAELVIEEAAKAHLCDTDGVKGKYSDSDRYYFEQLMKKQLGLV